MNYDTTENQNYQGLQNPSSSYSNNQNPPSSYLKNQSLGAAPTRVAQAKTAASKANQPTDKEILDILFPGEMKKVHVKNYNGVHGVPSVLVRDYGGFAAWTNSENDIYLNELIPGIDGFLRIYVLFHEGLHIRQFIKEGSPKLFQNMLKFEIQAYGKAVSWLDTKQAETLRIQTGMNKFEFRKLVNSERDNANKVFQVGNNAVENHILQINDGLSADEIDQEIYLEEMIFSLVRDKELEKGEAEEFSMLPDKYVDKDETKRYSIDDLYNDTNKSYFPVPKKNS